MGYDTGLYVDPEPRTVGNTANCETCTNVFGDVGAVVTWHPRGRDIISVTGAYLDGNRRSGDVTLNCGIEAMTRDLGLWPVIADDDEKRGVICDLVNRQLAVRPWAVLACPEGNARLELLHVR